MVSSNGDNEEEGRKGEELVVEEEADTGLPQDETDCCYRTLTSQRCCAAWPRTCACCLGVVLPLWLLIFLSLCFGVALASFEADAEIVRIDGRSLCCCICFWLTHHLFSLPSAGSQRSNLTRPGTGDRLDKTNTRFRQTHATDLFGSLCIT